MPSKFPTTLTQKTMIQITADQFEQLLPFVGAASEDVFTKMQPSFEGEYNELLENVIGEEFETEVFSAGSPMQEYTRHYVILSTFLLRLRSNDLIMTDTGFGVVSNENIAPASQARVDALERELTYKKDLALYSIINRLRVVDGWAETIQAITNIKSFIWCPQLLRRWLGASHNATSDDLAKRQIDIEQAENFLRRELSDAQIEELLSEERKATYKTNHRTAIFRICSFIGASISDKDAPVFPPDSSMQAFSQVLSFFEEHISDFPKYKDSTAYKANHMQAYENKTDDTTFFFSC